MKSKKSFLKRKGKNAGYAEKKQIDWTLMNFGNMMMLSIYRN